jgi:hypothetical protein
MRLSISFFFAYAVMMAAPGCFVVSEDAPLAVVPQDNEEIITHPPEEEDVLDALHPLLVEDETIPSLGVNPQFADAPEVAHQGGINLKEEGGGLPLHVFPLIFTFEVGQEAKLDAALMNEIESAVVMAANEVHDSEKMKFYGIFVKDVNQAEIDHEAGALANTQQYLRGKPLPCRLLAKCKPTGNPTNFRVEWFTDAPISCNLCDDNAYRALVAGQQSHLSMADQQPHLFMAEDLYLSASGREITTKWQQRFCQRLRAIKGLTSAKKCFIHLDTAHEDPIRSLDSYISTTLIDDIETDGVTLLATN